MTEAIMNEVQKESDLEDGNRQVVDLLSQHPIPHNDDVVVQDNVASTITENELLESGAGSDGDDIEELEIQEEESVDTVPTLAHLQPAVVHKNLQPMVDGKLHGVVEAHDQGGNLISHHYYEDGVLQGEARKYDGNQRIRDRVTYMNGAPHGPAEFYQNGKALMHAQYEYGELHGETTYYDPNSGMLTARVNHLNGKKSGTAITYDALGKPQRILQYADNVLEGPAFSYNGDGSVLQEGYYLQGRKHGQFTSYYKNGETRKIEFYENGRLTRKPVLYTPGGKEYEPKY